MAAPRRTPSVHTAASHSAVRTPAQRSRRIPAVAALCAGLAAAAAVAREAFAGAALRAATGSPVPARRTALKAEAFDPFGIKEAFKGAMGGVLDGSGTDEPPSRLEEEMMLEIFEKYDEDRDGILKLDEFNALQRATEGEDAVYNQDQLTDLLRSVNSGIKEPEKGMPFVDYRRLYAESRLKKAYGTDVTRDHVKVFGVAGGQAADRAQAALKKEAEEAAKAGPAVGSAVVIQGLSGAKELNGQTAHVVAPTEAEADMVAEGRLILELADGERVALKPTNVKVAETKSID